MPCMEEHIAYSAPDRTGSPGDIHPGDRRIQVDSVPALSLPDRFFIGRLYPLFAYGIARGEKQGNRGGKIGNKNKLKQSE